MDSLEASPGNKLNPLLTRPNITNVKLTHTAPQCLQSLQGSILLGEISKNLCINITQSTNDTQCLFSPGTFFVCGTATYISLPPGWKGICTTAPLTPKIDVVPRNQSLSILLEAYTRSKRAIQIIPLLIAMGITAGTGTSIGGISSVYTYQKVSREFTNDIEQVTLSLEALQDEVGSLASVVLQNRHALDLLTAEKGGTCLFIY
jgi:hypothetical protein